MDWSKIAAIIGILGTLASGVVWVGHEAGVHQQTVDRIQNDEVAIKYNTDEGAWIDKQLVNLANKKPIDWLAKPGFKYQPSESATTQP